MDLPAPLVALLARQHGLATRAQLTAHGVSDEAVRWRLGRQWRAVLPGVVATTPGTLSPAAWRDAVALYAGCEAVITGPAACRWYGLANTPVTSRIDVLVPMRQAARRSGDVVVRRTSRPDQRPRQAGLARIASPARAVADAARLHRHESAARAVVIEAVQRRLTDLECLAHEVHAGPRRGAATLRKALDDVHQGAWSLPEAELQQLLSASRVLPAVWANPILEVDGVRLPSPDGWFDDVALAVQVHSRRHHAGRLDWERTVETDGVFAEHGIPLVAITPARIRQDRAAVLRRVEAAYRAAADRPRPLVEARQRSTMR